MAYLNKECVKIWAYAYSYWEICDRNLLRTHRETKVKQYTLISFGAEV